MERERKRERKKRREGGRVQFLCRRAPIILPLLSRPWPSKWPCNVTVNSITIGRAAQVTETGSARGKGERERGEPALSCFVLEVEEEESIYF